jgi:hypothetical protein
MRREIHVVTPKGTRNRCGDINSDYQAGKISAKEAENRARKLAFGWSRHEPQTDFKVKWTDEAEPVSLLEELLDNINQELGLLIHVKGYLETCNQSDVVDLNLWLATRTDVQRDILLNGGDEELYALAPVGENGLPVSYIIQEFTV